MSVKQSGPGALLTFNESTGSHGKNKITPLVGYTAVGSHRGWVCKPDVQRASYVSYAEAAPNQLPATAPPPPPAGSPCDGEGQNETQLGILGSCLDWKRSVWMGRHKHLQCSLRSPKPTDPPGGCCGSPITWGSRMGRSAFLRGPLEPLLSFL